jgi:hypothetical protein
VADVPLFDLRHQNRDLKRARFIPTFLISHLESEASLAPLPYRSGEACQNKSIGGPVS